MKNDSKLELIYNDSTPNLRIRSVVTRK